MLGGLLGFSFGSLVWIVITWNFVPQWILGVDRDYVENGIESCELNLKRTQKCKVEIKFVEDLADDN